MSTKRSSSSNRKAARKAPQSARAKTSRPASQPALDVIDKGARLLKQAILKGEAETEEGRKILKKKALFFVEEASKALSSAIDGTASRVTKGLKKL